MAKNNDNPNYQESISQTRAILAYLREGNSITGEEARWMFHCSRLPSRICDIERITGSKPLRKKVPVPGFDTQGNPTKKWVMQYWLPEEELTTS